MEQGEWWIDDCGQLTFADGDIGDENHESVAFWSALEICPDDLRMDVIPGDRFTPAQSRELKRLGANAKAVRYLRDGSDARDYALKHVGWIRVKDANIQTWKLDDVTLENIKGADFWEEEDESDERTEAYVEELSTRKAWSIPFKVLLGAPNAAGLKRYMSGIGKYHRGDIDGLRAKRRRR